MNHQLSSTTIDYHQLPSTITNYYHQLAAADGAAAVKPKRKRKPRADPALSGSNMYSVSEGVLLKWLTYHYAAMAPPKPKRITNFDKDLRDG